MTLPSQNVWFTVNLAVRLKTTGALSSFDFSNRPAIDETGSYYPILKNISSLGSAMDDQLPISSSGTITLNNAPNSFGFERRFSDVLDRYTIVDQEVTIYAGQTAVTTLAPTVNQVWKGRVKTYKINVAAQTLDINVESAPISARVATNLIDAANFTSAPTKSYGQSLPIVFGTGQQVKPIQISADAATAPQYAYATTLGNSSSGYVNGGCTAYYVKDYDGVYRQLTSSAVATERNGYANSGSIGANVTYIDASAEFAWKTAFSSASTDNYLCTGMRLRNVGGGYGAGSVTGTITLKMYDEVNGKPNQVAFATATINKADYSASYLGAGVYDIYGSFDKPFLFSAGTHYYFGISATNESSPSITWITMDNDAAAYLYKRDPRASTYYGNNWSDGVSIGKPYFGFYCCLFTDTADPASGLVNSQTGLGYSYFTVTQNSAGTGQTNPDLTKLDYVAAISGLKDNAGGTISGGANYQIIDAFNACKLIDKEWSGSSWTGGRIDSAKFSSYQSGANNSGVGYARSLYGSTSSRATIADTLREICRSSGSRIASVSSTSSGKYLGFWAHGQQVATSAVITDEEANIISIEQRGVESIVNNVQGGYGRSYTTVDPTRWLIGGGEPDRIGSITLYNGSSGVGTMLCSVSATTYGQRYLGDAQFDFIGDSTSATNLAAAIIQKYAFPTVYVELEVPLFKYSTLSLLDVIEIVHPDLPAYFGTSSDAHNPTYTGTEVDMRDNLYWKRAQRYRAQIESETIDFNLGAVPTLRLVARLLLNSNDPT